MNVPNAYPEDLEVAARIAAHLKSEMFKRGWNKDRMAHELGINKATVTRITNEDTGVGLGLAVRICRRLMITPHRLLFEDP